MVIKKRPHKIYVVFLLLFCLWYAPIWDIFIPKLQREKKYQKEIMTKMVLQIPQADMGGILVEIMEVLGEIESKNKFQGFNIKRETLIIDLLIIKKNLKHFQGKDIVQIDYKYYHYLIYSYFGSMTLTDSFIIEANSKEDFSQAIVLANLLP